MVVQAEGETRPQFSQPTSQMAQMVVVLGLAGFGAFVALPQVMSVVLANPYLNGFIIFVFGIGVLSCFWQVIQLWISVRWIERFASGSFDASGKAPQLLAALATLLRTRGARMQLAATSTRSILDSVAQRVDEARDLTRYIVNLLIFLGLLGTFYGLATTVPGIVDTIRSLAPQGDEEGAAIFVRLMTGLETQLDGMGVAFSSSLLGLAGSLVVGLLEIFAGHGQNRFYRELEDWLSSITRVGLASGEEGSGEGAALAGIVDHLSEQIENLQDLFAASIESRALVDEKLGKIAEAMAKSSGVSEGLTGDSTAALERVAAGQERLINLMEAQGAGEGMDAESRMRLRSIDVQMLRILEEISAGRQETMSELRTDLAALTKAVANPPATAVGRGATTRRGGRIVTNRDEG